MALLFALFVGTHYPRTARPRPLADCLVIYSDPCVSASSCMAHAHLLVVARHCAASPLKSLMSCCASRSARTCGLLPTIHIPHQNSHSCLLGLVRTVAINPSIHPPFTRPPARPTIRPFVQAGRPAHPDELRRIQDNLQKKFYKKIFFKSRRCQFCPQANEHCGGRTAVGRASDKHSERWG